MKKIEKLYLPIGKKTQTTDNMLKINELIEVVNKLSDSLPTEEDRDCEPYCDGRNGKCDCTCHAKPSQVEECDCGAEIGQDHTASCPTQACPKCGYSKWIRNPSGHCDHLYYPENVAPKPECKCTWGCLKDGCKDCPVHCQSTPQTREDLTDLINKHRAEAIKEALDKVEKAIGKDDDLDYKGDWDSEGVTARNELRADLRKVLADTRGK